MTDGKMTEEVKNPHRNNANFEKESRNNEMGFPLDQPSSLPPLPLAPSHETPMT